MMSIRPKRGLVSLAAIAVVAMWCAAVSADEVKAGFLDDKAPPGGVRGISKSLEPSWSLVADADLKSLSVDKLSTGVGVERAGGATTFRFRLRAGISGSTISGDLGDDVFADAMSAPESIGYGASVGLEWRPLGFIRCDDCSLPADVRKVHTNVSVGLYGAVAASRAGIEAKREDETVFTERVVPLAAGAGIVVKIEGLLPISTHFTTDAVALSLYGGFTTRVIGGDLDATERRELLGDQARHAYYGFEFSSALQLNNIMLEPRIVWLPWTREEDELRAVEGGEEIDGLTGVQFQIGVRYVLPWDIVGKD